MPPPDTDNRPPVMFYGRVVRLVRPEPTRLSWVYRVLSFLVRHLCRPSKPAVVLQAQIAVHGAVLPAGPELTCGPGDGVEAGVLSAMQFGISVGAEQPAPVSEGLAVARNDFERSMKPSKN